MVIVVVIEGEKTEIKIIASVIINDVILVKERNEPFMKNYRKRQKCYFCMRQFFIF